MKFFIGIVPPDEIYTAVADIQKRFGDKAQDVLAVYHPASDAEVMQIATKLASDQFIGFSTWRWSDIQAQTSNKPVYRYMYARPRPQMRAEMGNAVAGLAGGVIRDSSATKTPPPPPATGAVHSAEIEYALGNLATNRVYDWQPEDFEVSQIMQAFFVNFITTGNPNGLGVPNWKPVEKNNAANVMHIDVNTGAATEQHRDQYLLMEKMATASK